MMLSQLVTLRPGSSSFSVTYRIVNPVGYRQGRRLWMDAVFPRNHLPSGTVQGTSPPPRKSDSQFIFPVAWVSTHNGRDLRRWTQADSPVAAYDNTVSIFAWNRRYGVAGVWYPSVKVNRLMISDVDAAPGAKLWFAGEQQKPAEPWWNFKYNFVEIWGGSDSVFEGVEHWIAPGESYQFTQHFALAGGIGKVDFANDRAAVNVELAGDTPRVEAVLFQDAGNVSATWNGKPLGQGNAKVGEPMRFDLPADANAGRLVLKADDQAVVDERFPLRIPADREGHDEIKAALKSSPASLEKAGDNAHFGEMFRAAIGKYPAGSVGRGRLLYRDGYLQAAVRCLRKAVSDDPSVGEGWHLMGVALLEQDKKKQAATALNKALVAKRPCVHARYYLAVIALGEKDFDSADEHLATLIEKRKNHWEAKLLRVYTLKKRGEVKKARDLAYEMYSEDPADPRLIWLGRLELGSLFREGCVREPGAKRRIEEFSKAMKGELRPPARLGY
jgi:tetratricopeptide (TPR) repeat protein